MDNTKPDDTPANRPRVLVLGTTGGSGRLIDRQALARGHDVAALPRFPQKGLAPNSGPSASGQTLPRSTASAFLERARKAPALAPDHG